MYDFRPNGGKGRRTLALIKIASLPTGIPPKTGSRRHNKALLASCSRPDPDVKV
jgi:hypothetical protein